MSHGKTQQAPTSRVLSIDQGQLVGVFTEPDVVITLAAQEHEFDH